MADIPAPPPGFQIEGQPNPDAAVGNIATLQGIHNQLQGMDPQERIKAFAALPPALQQGIQRMVAQQASTPEAQQARFQQAQAQNVNDMGTLGRLWTGVGEGASNFWSGVKENAIDRPLDLITGGDRVAQDQQRIADERELSAPLNKTAAGAIGNMIGGVAESAPLALIPGGAATTLGRIGAGALAGGAYGYLSPSASSGEEIGNTIAGTALGGVSRAASPVLDYLGMKAAPVVSEAKQAGIDLANKYGIPLHIGQVSDGRFTKSLAAAGKYLPFSGAAGTDRAQQQAFNRALSQQIGENSPTISDDVLGNAANRIGQGYNDLFARTQVKINPGSVSKLGALWQQASKDLPPDQAQVVQNQITKYFDAAQANGGQIPGRLYQNIRAGLQDVEGRGAPYSHLVGQVRKTMQDAAESSMGPQDADALKALNGQYNSLKILQKGTKRANGANEDISPASLWSLVNQKYGSTQGMRDLARMGQTVLKDQVANSGTAQRELAYRYLMGGDIPLAFYSPHAAAALAAPAAVGMTLGRALNSPLVARTLPYAGQNALGLLSRGAQALPYTLPVMVMDARSAPPSPTAPQTP